MLLFSLKGSRLLFNVRTREEDIYVTELKSITASVSI